MLTVLYRLTLPLALVFALVACSQPTASVLPTLSEVAEDTAALTSFVALAEALDIDLDAATASGLFTVFAPSNDLVEKYADAWGFADAAALLAAIDTLTADQTKAVTNFVGAHIVSGFPVLMTEDFLTDYITGSEWYWYIFPEFAAGDQAFTHVWNYFSIDDGSDELRLYFWGEVAGQRIFVELRDGVDLVATDVAFKNGIVHVIDATVSIWQFF